MTDKPCVYQSLPLLCLYLCEDDITRLLESTTTQLKEISFGRNHQIFYNEVTTQHFTAAIIKNTSVQELPSIHNFFPQNYAIINNCLTRNRQLNHLHLLLTPPPQLHWNAGTMMLKISHKAITEFAKVPHNAGSSAIFKLFTARPQLLEKRLKRSTFETAANATVSQEQKRRCL